MSEVICQISGDTFRVSDFEKSMRAKFGFSETLPSIKPLYRFRELGAFWPHWNLHPRSCDRTGQNIISIFRPDCSYPVWHRDEWVKHADPPSRDCDFSRNFFEQAWEMFQKSPLPHNFQSHNENSEYADDFYHSKNCYLCHSCNTLEDCRYCYLGTKSKDVQFCIYSQQCELGSDIVHCRDCFDVRYVLYCRNVQASSFLYDCRRCSDCMFCFNLRDKQYCFANQQLTKDEYEKKKSQWNLRSRNAFEKAKQWFREMMVSHAWHRALFIDHSENVTGNYLTNCKDCEDCFISPNHEECVHDFTSGPHTKSTLDSLGTIGSELLYYTAMVVYSYGCRFSFELNECKRCDYCCYCFFCQDCFGCCGLYKKRFCIFNKQYSEAEYYTLMAKIVDHMKKTGEWGKFFPGYFAPNPYDESCSGFHFPLSLDQQKKLGFRAEGRIERKAKSMFSIQDIPDAVDGMTTPAEVFFSQKAFWDEDYERPFQITKEDIAMSRKINVPFLYCYYVKRMQDNFRWMPFTGELRSTTCAKSGVAIMTSWPPEYDGRILSEEEYVKIVL